MRRAALTALLVFTCVLGAGAAVASSGSAGDRRGDVQGEPVGGAARADIVRTSYGHTKDGRLWHKVTVAGTAADPAKGELVPMIYLEIRERPSATPVCDIFIGRYRGRLGVFECGTSERIGSARIVRSGRSTTKYVFRPSAIGDPPSYDWAAIFVGSSDGTQVWHDRAPDQDDVWFTHRLR
jgi:hypothetical protein